MISALTSPSLIAVVPAAGVGKRMQADCPKQYLMINKLTVLEHTVQALLSHQLINRVIISLGVDDQYFVQTSLASNPCVDVVVGGKERADSVQAGLRAINSEKYPWVLVHDAARPCLCQHDLNQLIDQCLQHNKGGILASPVQDTMKRGDGVIKQTIDREQLWHALTPQMFPTKQLLSAIDAAQAQNRLLTDEASAIEFVAGSTLLVAGRRDNIKITQPDDLAYAEFILNNRSKRK